MAGLIDETGNKYGRLTVIESAGRDRTGNAVWECLCDCGNRVNVLGGNLRKGHTKSCGCLMSARGLFICSVCGKEKIYFSKDMCRQCYNRKYNRENIERLSQLRYEYRLEKTYNIALSDYDEMLEAQGGGCWICGITPEESGKRLVVDHCHSTGKVRGLLCGNCNCMLGYAKESSLSLARGIEYLETFDGE